MIISYTQQYKMETLSCERLQGSVFMTCTELLTTDLILHIAINLHLLHHLPLWDSTLTCCHRLLTRILVGPSQVVLDLDETLVCAYNSALLPTDLEQIALRGALTTFTMHCQGQETVRSHTERHVHLLFCHLSLMCSPLSSLSTPRVVVVCGVEVDPIES